MLQVVGNAKKEPHQQGCQGFRVLEMSTDSNGLSMAKDASFCNISSRLLKLKRLTDSGMFWLRLVV